jgi:hypothetical protein
MLVVEFLVIGMAFSIAFFACRLSRLAALLLGGGTLEEAEGREVVACKAGIEVSCFLEAGVCVFRPEYAESLRFSVEGVGMTGNAEGCCAREPLAYLPAFGLVGMTGL